MPLHACKGVIHGCQRSRMQARAHNIQCTPGLLLPFITQSSCEITATVEPPQSHLSINVDFHSLWLQGGYFLCCHNQHSVIHPCSYSLDVQILGQLEGAAELPHSALVSSPAQSCRYLDAKPNDIADTTSPKLSRYKWC